MSGRQTYGDLNEPRGSDDFGELEFDVHVAVSAVSVEDVVETAVVFDRRRDDLESVREVCAFAANAHLRREMPTWGRESHAHKVEVVGGFLHETAVEERVAEQL